MTTTTVWGLPVDAAHLADTDSATDTDRNDLMIGLTIGTAVVGLFAALGHPILAAVLAVTLGAIVALGALEARHEAPHASLPSKATLDNLYNMGIDS